MTVEYIVSPDRQGKFAKEIEKYGRVRRRNGAYRWGIFHDTEIADRYLEIFLVNSWAEHLRQHERQTPADHQLEQALGGCLAREPKVHHLIYAYSRQT